MCSTGWNLISIRAPGVKSDWKFWLIPHVCTKVGEEAQGRANWGQLCGSVCWWGCTTASTSCWKADQIQAPTGSSADAAGCSLALDKRMSVPMYFSVWSTDRLLYYFITEVWCKIAFTSKCVCYSTCDPNGTAQLLEWDLFFFSSSFCWKILKSPCCYREVNNLHVPHSRWYRNVGGVFYNNLFSHGKLRCREVSFWCLRMNQWQRENAWVQEFKEQHFLKF